MVQQSVRVIAFDGGNHITACAVADITEAGLTVHYIGTVEVTGKPLKAYYEPFFVANIDRFLECELPILVLYESVIFNNFRLLAVNKCIKTYFTAKKVVVRPIHPKQKWGVKSKKDVDRKRDAVVSAREVLATQEQWLIETFEQADRKHDMADALLMIKYLHVYPELLSKKLYGKKTATSKRKRNTE
jgi:hypothetical protein